MPEKSVASNERRLLMAPPQHFGVLYEINPWMNREVQVSPTSATEQWNGLYRVLIKELEAEVLLAEPQPGLPDMVFTANAGLVYGDRAIVSTFRHPERQGESAHFASWFAAHGFQVEWLPEDCCFEGEGDALFVGDTLFAGYFWRSDVRAHALLGDRLGVRVLSVQLVDPQFYHLDTCFCPLDDVTAAYYPPAFDEYACRVLQANIPHLIEVRPDEAARFAANAVVLGKRVVLNTGCTGFESDLQALGFTTYSVPLDEFLKAGGSAKCLTLHLDRSH